MIGTDFCYCVRDLVNGDVRQEEVKYIIIMKELKTHEDCMRFLARFLKNCPENPQRVKSIVSSLWHSGQLKMPQTERVMNAWITKGDSWVDSENQILVVDRQKYKKMMELRSMAA